MERTSELAAVIQKIMRAYGVEYYAVSEGSLVFTVPYAPVEYPSDCYRVDGYYMVSNKTYHAVSGMISDLGAEGITAKRHKGNLRKLARKAGLVGILGNGFAYCDKYGSFLFICALDLSIAAAASECAVLPKITKRCLCCGRCIQACPTGALNKEGFNPELCLRQLQEKADGLVDSQLTAARSLGDRLLGCSQCQRACPVNACVKAIPAPAELCVILKKDGAREALSGDANVQYLKELIGVNVARKSKLTAIVDLLEGSLEKENTDA